MGFFKTKHNYHDSEIIGYKWEGNDLILQIDPCYPSTPSEIRFLGVKDKNFIDQDLSKRDYRWHMHKCNIYSIEKTNKHEFTIFIDPALKINCDNISEI